MLLNQVEQILKANKKNISQLGVHSLAVFCASNMHEKYRNNIDILVDFDSTQGLFVFLDLKYYLEDILKCQVALVAKKSLHPCLKKRILRETRRIF